MFGEVLALCAKGGLVSVGAIAVDGTKVHANACSTKITMIVELPSGSCTQRARWRLRVSTAKAAFQRSCGHPPTASFEPLHGSATIDGGGFFDFSTAKGAWRPTGSNCTLSFASQAAADLALIARADCQGLCRDLPESAWRRRRAVRRESVPGCRACVFRHSSRVGSIPARRWAAAQAVCACRRRLASPSGTISRCSVSARRWRPQKGQR